MREVSIKNFANVRIGNAENVTAGTGCTVFIFPEGAGAGLSIRGGGPASRESELLKPLASAGMNHCMKTGIGSYAVEIGGLMAGAVVAVNSLGDVYDWKTGRKIAGVLDDDGRTFARTDDVIYGGIDSMGGFAWNSTLAVFMTNAKFRKLELCKIADMSHDGFARSIRPVHTGSDGDSVYAVSLGEFEADIDTVGSLAADVVSEAIIRAVMSAESAYGFPSAKSLA